MKVAHSVIDRALNQIKPSADRRDACRRKIADCIGVLQEIEARTKELPSPKELKRSYEDAAKAYERAIKTTRKLHPMQRRYFEKVLPALEEAVKVANFLADATIVPKGSQVLDDVKALAEVCARNFLKEHGHDPTLTDGGALYALASILYEGATGKPEEDLSYYCRDSPRFSRRYRMRLPPGWTFSGD
jgi:hypothetical protein